MERQVQCPVCTLYLHEGMFLQAHLDTHPKDQVIQALCSLAKSGKSSSHYGSRGSTPYASERSYRSRSRTPATCDSRHYHHRPPRSSRPPSRSRSPTDYRPSIKSNSSSETSPSNKNDSFQSSRHGHEPMRIVNTPLQSDSGYADKTDSVFGDIADKPHHQTKHPRERPASVTSPGYARPGDVFIKEPDSETRTSFAQPCPYPNKAAYKDETSKRNDGIPMLKRLPLKNQDGISIDCVNPGAQPYSPNSHKNMLISSALPGPSSGKNFLFANQFAPISSASPSRTFTRHGDAVYIKDPASGDSETMVAFVQPMMAAQSASCAYSNRTDFKDDVKKIDPAPVLKRLQYINSDVKLSSDSIHIVNSHLRPDNFVEKSDVAFKAGDSSQQQVPHQSSSKHMKDRADASTPTRNFTRHGDLVFIKDTASGDAKTAGFVQPKMTVMQPTSCAYPNKTMTKDRECSVDISTVNDNLPMLKRLPYVNPEGITLDRMIPASQPYVQSSHNNIVISSSLPGPGSGHGGKSILGSLFSNQFAPISTASFQRNATVTNQNSPIFYQEIREVGGKQVLSAVPVSGNREEAAAQAGNVHQNVMLYNQYSGSSACVYPQQSAGSNVNQCYSDVTLSAQSLQTACNNFSNKLPMNVDGHSMLNIYADISQNLHTETRHSDNSINDKSVDSNLTDLIEIMPDRSNGEVNDNASTKSSGVKILSNIKVEIPMSNNNMIPEIIDLTLAHDLQRKKMLPEIAEPNLNEDEAILPDYADEELSGSYSPGRFSNRDDYSGSRSVISSSPLDGSVAGLPVPVEITSSKSGLQPGAIVNTFSVIKNIGNPNLYKDSVASSSQNPDCDEKASEQEQILPDLTCNEKPSISPCSDLTNDSNEEPYERLCAVPQSSNHPDKPSGNVSRFPLSMVTRSVARKNLFIKKPRKILAIKNSKSNVKHVDKASSSSSVSNLKTSTPKIVPSKKDDRRPETSLTGTGRLDVFFKEIDKFKKGSELTIVPSGLSDKSALQLECRSFSTAGKDDSTSFDADTKEQSPIMTEPQCSVQTFNEFHPRNCPADNVLKSIDGESSAQHHSEGPQKNFVELETMRPVNVIAFGSLLNSSPAPDIGATSGFTDASQKLSIESDGLLKEKQTLAHLIQDSYINENSYAEYFSSDKEFAGAVPGNVLPGNVVQKMELCIIDDDVPKDSEYIWDETPQKEEFAFSNFMQCNYAQGIYVDSKDTKGSTSQTPQFSAGDMCEDDHNDYAELICPRDSYLEPEEHKGSFLEAMGSSRPGPGPDVAALNIRTDERMPPRGELSEQESSGDVDAPWGGMYRDVGMVGGSTSYDLLARETWASDASDVDAPAVPPKHAFSEVEDMPIVVAVKPPDRNYKCATCGKSFNCPKERRVHRTKEHPVNGPPPLPGQPRKPPVKRRRGMPVNIKIKNEKILKTEGLLSKMIEGDTPDIQDPSIVNIKIVQDELREEIEGTEKKPDLVIVKEEVKKKRKDYCCVTCKKDFCSDSSFNEHLKIHPLECLTCGKFFNRRANLQLHIKRHLGIKNYRCDICEKRFITKQKMVEHYNVHTGSAPIKCSLCDETFRRHSNMVQHRNRHHFHLKRRLRDYVCHCGEVFHSKKKLAWHREIHDDRPKACLHCSEKFIHVASLTRHMRRAHNNYYVPDEKRKRENVQCPICSHVYLKTSIDMHLRTHTGKKPYSCVICNKNFTTKWNLKLHRWTHANRSSKPFKCAMCKGAFIRHADYISHMNAHKSVRPYTCNYCGCQFIRKYNCQRHVKEHENSKKYVCQVPECGKTFHRSYYLSEHMRVHSGARPFSCNICGKTSSTKSNHNKHVKIHHAREPVTTEG